MPLLYEEPEPIDREELKEALSSSLPDIVSGAIIRMSLHESDRIWAERVSLDALRHPSIEVRAAALTAIGNLVRRFKTLDLQAILTAIEEASKEPALKGMAEDTLDDIRIFASTN